MNNAYVTVLSTNDYYKGVLALFESLKQTNPKYNNFIIIINENIDKNIINILLNKGYIVIKKDKIESSFVENISYKHWNNTFDKFNIFDLTEYNKIVYLDSDMYICKNIDELFDMPNMSAAIAGKTYYKEWDCINSGLMVIEPKKGILEGLKELLYSKELNKHIGDQDIIEKYFDWHNKNLEISEKYNLFAFLIDYYINNYDYNIDNIKIIHFIGSIKPWMLDEKGIKEHKENLLKENKNNELYYFEKYEEILKHI